MSKLLAASHGKAVSEQVIIASDITEELSIAVSRVTGVRLAEYHMSFAIEPIGPT